MWRPPAGGAWAKEVEVPRGPGTDPARVTSSALQARVRLRRWVRARALCGAQLLGVHDQQHVDGHSVALLLQLHDAAALPAGSPRLLVRLPVLQMAPRAPLPGLARERERARERALPRRPSRWAPRFADSAKLAIRALPGGRYPNGAALSHL